MSFAEILTRLGETGELGEDPRIYWLAGEAKKGLISPATGDAGEPLAPISPALAKPNPAPINDLSPISPISPDALAELRRLITAYATEYVSAGRTVEGYPLLRAVYRHGWSAEEIDDALRAAESDLDGALAFWRGRHNHIYINTLKDIKNGRSNA